MLLCRDNPDTSKLPYPVYVCPKLDGIRCVIIEATPKSRTLKDIPNEHIRRYLQQSVLDGLDGELIVGPPNAPDVYNKTESIVMSKSKEPGDWAYYVFDTQDPKKPYHQRMDELDYVVLMEKDPRVKLVQRTLVHNEAQLLDAEQCYLNMGYEGVIIRCRDGMYVPTRTGKKPNAYKLKRFTDSEAVITGMLPEMENQNAKEINELGRTKRSKKQEGLVAKDRMGALIVKDPAFKGEFRIGSGFNHEQRAEMWKNSVDYIGKTVVYKYFNHGIKDLPRHPIWKGMRDMSIDG